MSAGTIALPLLCALLAGCAYLLCGVAARGRFLADAVSARSNHSRPTSRGGGGIILLLFAVVLVVASFGRGVMPAGLAVLCLLAGGLGLSDDRLDLPALPKLLVLIVLAVVTGIAAGPVAAVPVPFLGAVGLPPVLGYGVAAFFVLGFVNVFNFMDGLNGMAAGVAMVGLGLVTLSGPLDAEIAFAALVLAGGLYGFAIRNILRGDIFLGDAGSLSLGLFLAGAMLAGGQGDDGLGFSALVIAFLPYLLDTGITLVRRWRRGAPLMQAHKEHFYQRLRAKGWSHQAVALAYAGMTLAAGLLGQGGLWLMGAAGLYLAAAAVAGMFFAVVGAMMRRSGQAHDGAQGKALERPA